MLSSRTSISFTFEELGGEGMGGLSKHFRLITASTAKIHQNSTAPFFLIRQLSSSIAMPAEHRVIPTLPEGSIWPKTSCALRAQWIVVITALCGKEQATISLG